MACRTTMQTRRVYLYGASVVAPGAANLKEFLSLLSESKCSLTLKKSFSDLFLVGVPTFDFSQYKTWLDKRHEPKRFSLLNEKSGEVVKFAIGSLIDALETNPGLEKALQTLDPNLAIHYAHGLGDIPMICKLSRQTDAVFFKWNAFWADPARNQLYQEYLNNKIELHDVPKNPNSFLSDSFERYEALQVWNAYWAEKSIELKNLLNELKEIESHIVQGEDIETAKLSLIRWKTKAKRNLFEKYQCPTPPWEAASPNLLWNTQSVPASQVSMLLNLHGVANGFAGACASFGTLVEQALYDIRSGKIDAAIVGASDAVPSDEVISAFYNGRLAVLGDSPSIPFCDLRGTHVSGGACTWIIAAEDAMSPLGVKPLGVEILGAGTSSDAEHIITPSKNGPKLAIERAFANAQVVSSQIQLWDMHATGTPGDWNEFTLIEDYVPQSAYISARKGIFGHGMAVSGGWELTAQLLGIQSLNSNTYRLLPSGIDPKKVNPKILSLKRNLLLNNFQDISVSEEGLICGKISLGVGGTTSCVIAKVKL
ncbi:beta-ketoacyl synthase N-terminal-like domain-containing protein [Spirobacillus cienkowskii]|uniref:beta-ketoacyl synthase N-terminal-like domain-containing protein n=1 Tax=Spirobacillus cienkowskii TaxID=495820 RepID=UPI0030D34581